MPTSDQGLDKQRYSVIPRTLIFVFRDNEVLLLKGSETKKIWAGKYNGLGGHIEAGEDVLTSANRELAEEAGIINIDLHCCGVVMCDVESQHGIAVFLFRGEYGGQALITSEEGNLHWVSMSSLAQLSLVEDLIVLLPKVWHWKPGDPLLSGLNYYDNEGHLITRFH
jgi:8-oxo-dGTP diphosphatase